MTRRSTAGVREMAGRTLATQFSFDAMRGVTELTVIAPDHPRLLSIIAGACAAAGANIVDAQIFTTTDGLALDTIAVTREFEHDEDGARRAGRCATRDISCTITASALRPRRKWGVKSKVS